MIELSQDRLKELMFYDPNKGVFSFINENKSTSGWESDGYLKLRVDRHLIGAELALVKKRNEIHGRFAKHN